MLLCLDIGNSNIVGGIFPFSAPGNGTLPGAEKAPLLCFRHECSSTITSDQFGTFLKSVLRENAIDSAAIRHIAISSVVPAFDYSLHSACKKYFNITPFLLKTGVKTGIKIKTQHPNEVGADLIAGAIAATHQFPARDLIIVDLGTATTLMAVTAAKEFLGGAIIAGLRLSVNALSQGTAKLSAIEITRADSALGRSSTGAMQGGLYFSHLGAMKEIIARITKEAFPASKPIIIGTGGFAHLYQPQTDFLRLHSIDPSSLEFPRGAREASKRSVLDIHEHCERACNKAENQNAKGIFAEAKIFDTIVPNLVLHGLRLALMLNANV